MPTQAESSGDLGGNKSEAGLLPSFSGHAFFARQREQSRCEDGDVEQPKRKDKAHITGASIQKGKFPNCLESPAKNMGAATERGAVRCEEHRDVFLGDKMA